MEEVALSSRKGGTVKGITSKRFVYIKKRRLTPKQLELFEFRKVRLQKAIGLFIAGATYQQIVDANIGYNSIASVSRDMRKAIDESVVKASTELIAGQLLKLEEMYRFCYVRFRNDGDLNQVDRMMRILREIREICHYGKGSDENSDSVNVTNSGVMIVNGTSRQNERIAALMSMANASEEEVEQQIRRMRESPQKAIEAPKEVSVSEDVQNTSKRLRIARREHQVNEHSTITAPVQRDTSRDIEDAEIIDVEPVEEEIYE